MSKFSCPHCKVNINADERSRGRKAVCPSCDGEITVPGELDAYVIELEPSKESFLNRAYRVFSPLVLIVLLAITTVAWNKRNGLYSEKKSLESRFRELVPAVEDLKAMAANDQKNENARMEANRLEITRLKGLQKQAEKMKDQAEAKTDSLRNSLTNLTTKLEKEKAQLATLSEREVAWNARDKAAPGDAGRPIYKIDGVYLDAHVDDRQFATEYFIFATHESERLVARFLFQDPAGGKGSQIMLSPPADLLFQGTRVNWHAHVPSALDEIVTIPAVLLGGHKLGHYYYHGDNGQYSKEIDINYTHHNGKSYRHQLPNIASVEIPEQLKGLSISRGLVLPWLGPPLGADEKVTLQIDGILSNGSKHGIATYHLTKRGASGFAIKGSDINRKYNEPQELVLSLVREKVVVIPDGGPSGKLKIHLKYVSKSMTVPTLP